MEFYEKISTDPNECFLAVIIISIVAGVFLKYVDGTEKRKWIVSTIGILICWHVMEDKDLWHFFLVRLLGIYIIKKVGKRKCHIAALFFMFTYITVYRIVRYTDRPPLMLVINFAMMMLTLKIVGVAFEIHNSHKPSDDPNHVYEPIDPSFMDMLHYSLSFYGCITGPYIRYRTYDDYIKLPFSRVWDLNCFFEKITTVFVQNKLHRYFLSWPIAYLTTEAFEKDSFIEQIIYTIMQSQAFYVWVNAGMELSEAMCAAGGIGAYPPEAKCRSGQGPTINHTKLKEITYEEAIHLSYDYKTMQSSEHVKYYITPWTDEKARNYNMTVQYFMAVCVYKAIPKKYFSAGVRGLLTILASGIWHGIYAACFLSPVMVLILVTVDKLYMNIITHLTGWKKIILFINICLVQEFHTAVVRNCVNLFYLDSILAYVRGMGYPGLMFYITVVIIGYVGNIYLVPKKEKLKNA